ncbi:hypothetical protein ACP70R_015301 [Stipagrostis hirtigluma subsp. patula]
MSSEKEATSENPDPMPPCQVCKKERRRCEPGCTFAPYFPPDDNPARYNAVHQIFGYSHVDNLLAGTPPERRQDAVDTLVRIAREELPGHVEHDVAFLPSDPADAAPEQDDHPAMQGEGVAAPEQDDHLAAMRYKAKGKAVAAPEQDDHLEAARQAAVLRNSAAMRQMEDFLMMEHPAAATGLESLQEFQTTVAEYTALLQNAPQPPPLQTVLPRRRRAAAAAQQQQQPAATGLNLTLPLVQHQDKQMMLQRTRQERRRRARARTWLNARARELAVQQMILQMQMAQFAAAFGNAGQLPPLHTVLPMAQAQQLAAGISPQDTLMMHHAAAQELLAATGLDLTQPLVQHQDQQMMLQQTRQERRRRAKERARARTWLNARARALASQQRILQMQMAQAQQLAAGTAPQGILMMQHHAAAQQHVHEIDVRMQQAAAVMGAAPGSSSGGTAVAFQPLGTADADPFLVQQQPQDDALGLQMDPALPPLPPALGQGNDQVPNQQDMDGGDADDRRT